MQLLEHFKELSLHPKNAKELKGLILQLAVQGKLTNKWREEHPDVEPASVLLERVKKEKEQLVKEKKLKKELQLTPIRNDEIHFQLPQYWTWSRMLDFCYVITDGAHHTPKYVDKGVPFLSVKNLSKGFIDFSDTKFIEKETHLELIKRCNPEYEDILLTKIGTTGIAKVVDTKQDFSIFVSVALLKIVKGELYPEYIEYCINSPFIKKQSSEGTEGVGNKNLVLRKIKAFHVPLPPLEEQKAIVEVVNQLFAEVDQLETLTKERITLKEDFVTSALKQLSTGDTSTEWAFLKEHFSTFFTEKANIKKLRESILQLAVQGKLTSDWRKQRTLSGVEVEHASVLLKRIQKEKEQLVKEKKIKKENPLPKISDEEIPYELPEGWVWCRFQEVTILITDGKHGNCQDESNSGYYFLSAKDVQNGNLIYNRARQINFKEFSEVHQRTNLKAGDLCIVNTGATVGKTAIVKDDEKTEKSTFQKSVAIVKMLPQYVDVSYVEGFIKAVTPNLLKKSGGSAINNLLLGDMKMLLIPFPCYEEQKNIVQKVNSLMALCDELEAAIETSKTTQELWMESSLREVFSGTLATLAE